MSQQDSEPVSQQDSIPPIEATQPEIPFISSTPDGAVPNPDVPPPPPPPVDDMEAKCVTIFHLTEGRKYQNNINLPPSQIENVRRGMLKSIEESKENSLVSIQGSKNSPIDFCIIPVRNIIYFELKVIEITKKKLND